MARRWTQEIPETQCIGDSLDTINANYEKLDTAVIDLSAFRSSPIVADETATIDLTLTNGRNLRGDVVAGSIGGTQLAQGTVARVFTQAFQSPIDASILPEGGTLPLFIDVQSSATSNIMLVQASINIEASRAGVLYLTKAGNRIGDPTSPGARIGGLVAVPSGTPSLGGVTQNLFLQYGEAAGNTGTIRYQIGFRPLNPAGLNTAVFVNRGSDDTDSNANERTISYITVLEIKG